MTHMHLCLGTAVIAASQATCLGFLALIMLWVLLLLWQLVTYIDLCLVLADHCCKEEPAERFSLFRGTSARLKLSKVPATAICLATSDHPPLMFLQEHNTDVRLHGKCSGRERIVSGSGLRFMHRQGPQSHGAEMAWTDAAFMSSQTRLREWAECPAVLS